jgi:hypothetical protein
MALTQVQTAMLGTGAVLQVVNASYSTETVNATSTYADTGLTATITPKFSTSKILVLVDQNGCFKNNGSGVLKLQLLRGASVLILMDGYGGYNGAGSNEAGSISTNYLDSPATTSATTYKTQFNSSNNTANVLVQTSSSVSTITLMEIAG